MIATLFSTVLVILRNTDRDQLLMGVGKSGLNTKKLNHPGGKIHLGEAPAQAAVREVEEELGVQIDRRDLQYSGSILFSFE